MAFVSLNAIREKKFSQQLPDYSKWSYMNAHVLMNLLNELRKSDKIQGKRASHLLLILNLFNKINNTGAPMLDSIYNMTFTLLFNY